VTRRPFARENSRRYPLRISELAQVSCMSPRNFSRIFKEETGLAPAKAVERLRVDAARAALESGRAAIQSVALACGFGDPERMRRSFVRVLGAPPSAIRRQGRRD
jgi:transcriptional regulator GlxA family with amidase domain